MGTIGRKRGVYAASTNGALDEKALVERAKRDPEAFGLLYDAYFPRVYSFVYRRLGTRAAAEDVTAETFTRALGKLAGFRWTRGGFGAWLFRIARNLAIDEIRRRSTSALLAAEGAFGGKVPGKAAVGGAAIHRGDEAGPEEAALDAELARRLRSLVAGLPEAQREVILMRFSAGLDNREIAVATGRSATAVSSLLHRATTKLRKELARDRGWR